MQYNGAHYNVYNYYTNVFLNGDSEQRDLSDCDEKRPGWVQCKPGLEVWLSSVVQLIIAALEPTKIYRVQHKSTSEDPGFVDLLIMIPANRGKPFAEMEPAVSLPFSTEVELNCTLHCESNVRRALQDGHLFYTFTIKPKNLIYDSKASDPFPQPTAEDLAALREKTANQWQQQSAKAVQFYKSAIDLCADSAALKVFMLHQAAELTLRAIIQNLIGMEKKTHEIRVLRKHVRRIAPELSRVFSDEREEDVQLLQLLEDAYVKSRYDNQFSIKEDQLDFLEKKVKLIMEKAAAAVQHHLDSLPAVS